MFFLVWVWPPYSRNRNLRDILVQTKLPSLMREKNIDVGVSVFQIKISKKIIGTIHYIGFYKDLAQGRRIVFMSSFVQFVMSVCEWNKKFIVDMYGPTQVITSETKKKLIHLLLNIFYNMVYCQWEWRDCRGMSIGQIGREKRGKGSGYFNWG